MAKVKERKKEATGHVEKFPDAEIGLKRDKACNKAGEEPALKVGVSPTLTER